MSARLVLSKAWKHGRQVVQNVIRNKIGKPPVAERAKPVNIGKIHQERQLLIGRLFPHLPTRTLASELRRRAATRFALPGRPTLLPTFAFAFAGFALQGQQQETAKDDLSSEVREIFHEHHEKGSIFDKVQQLSLGVFDLGNLIGQGCNAAVYKAKFKAPQDEVVLPPESDTENDAFLDDIRNGNDDDSDSVFDSDSDFVVLGDLSDQEDEMADDSLVICSSGAQGETTVTGPSLVEEQEETTFPDPHQEQETDDYNLAIKMMYNYDIESNADAIMCAMLKEAVPARWLTVNQDDNALWQNGNRVRLKSLPAHPNIVEMLGVFVDPLPDLPDALDNYPAALPQRLNPQGLGRNQTMFLVMKKYDLTLRQILRQEELSPHIRCLLLCQLLEGSVHLKQHGIAHRDLKSDNILLDCHNEGTAPHLVISDFGCCLADEENGLQLPYPTIEINKGGNGALMPPEISCTAPGRNVKLDYSKSDLWAIGSLAYEIFDQDNPFYGGARITRKLDGRTYHDSDIPSMLGDVPDVVKFLVPRMLHRDPAQRPEPEMAANLLQIYHHFPEWLRPGNTPSKQHITENVMLLVTQMLIGWKLKGERLYTVEKQLQLTFLRRLVISDLVHALAYYHGN
ncbi:serine/threonine-protein kinase Pink1, mitochondrial-like [Ylistrum balloti]|uniref:serine/threonine-protein kinase Pink1, mitochondrial-like n=1 Tax=Ylistrum balloti TaxID=509963 RepID=UPI002905A645|nr:serine/threonine-protein kinase Pink1, mitochondrial-like [Ylistrum balloti]